jgi:hypothetical protein
MPSTLGPIRQNRREGGTRSKPSTYSERPRRGRGRCVFGGARPSAPRNTSSVLRDGRSLSTISPEPRASVNVRRLCCRADRAPGAAPTVFALGFKRLRRARGPRPGQYQPLVARRGAVWGRTSGLVVAEGGRRPWDLRAMWGRSRRSIAAWAEPTRQSEGSRG